MQKKRKKRIIALILVVGLAAALVANLFWNGYLLLNNPPKERYPVRGVDVSSYQGEIDWVKLTENNLDFAFIKATEGSSFCDSFFKKNWAAAIQTDLLIGAYHFFSFDSPGQTQAENFIKNVPKRPGTLPPVIDVEFYGDYASNPPDARAVKKELTIMLQMLETYYGVPPILYSTKESYALYLAGDFAKNPLWVRSVYASIDYPADGGWTFWQYANRGRLNGYQGPEKFIDLNVFAGDLEALKKLALPEVS